jgi:hypothetical protein
MSTGLNKTAYLQGKEAKINGHERASAPYKLCVAAWYWHAGYEGQKVTNFSKAHRLKSKNEDGKNS